MWASSEALILRSVNTATRRVGKSHRDGSSRTQLTLLATCQQTRYMTAEARTQLKLLASVPADAIDVPALRQAIETARAAGVSAMLLRAAASNLQDAIAQQQQAVDDRAGSQPAAFAERKEEFAKRSDEKVRQVLQDQDQEPDWGVWCAGG